MNPPARPPFPTRSRRGSGIIAVLIFTTAMLLLSGSLLSWSTNERKLTYRAAAWLEARNAAEAVSEYGCFQVAQAFNTRMNPTFGTGGTTSISFTSTLASTFFSGGKVDTNTISLSAGAVTQVPTGHLYYVDPSDANNRFDPLVGRYVFRRDVTVVSKATVNPGTGGGGPVSAYILQKVSVRGAPLFAYAIFYSGNDLEVNQSPQMDIYGPVHVNGHLMVGPVGTSALSFHGPVTASGHVFHAWRGTTATAQQGSGSMNDTTPVNFSVDIAGASVVSMRTSAGVWNDSTMGADGAIDGIGSLLPLVTAQRSVSFSQFSSQTWNGNLQSAAMGIQSYNPMGYSEPVGSVSGAIVYATDAAADNGANVGTGAGYGHGFGPHALIETPLTVSASDPYVSGKSAIEEQKFSRKAGLYLQVTVTATNSATLQLFSHSSSSGTGPNGGVLLGTVPSNLVKFIPYTTTGSGTSTSVSSGMYDQHEDKGVNLVQIDMGVLKAALVNMGTSTASSIAGTTIVTSTGAKWGVGSSNGYDTYTATSSGWNGGIYVGITSSSSNLTGVVLANGQVSSGSNLVPSSTSASNTNSVSGLTIATNSPVYVLGNYNADGTIDAAGTTDTSAQFPDDHHTGASGDASTQTPAAIAADAVMVLSPNYFGTAAGTKLAPTTNTSGTSAYNSYRTSSPAASADSEIAAAFITGTITTTPDAAGTQQYSGGVHNLPRFLENWSGRTLGIRGSLVTMYNSRIATTGWSSSYYSPPTRLWGFDKIFSNGNFPPICPQVISYRRVDFTYLSNSASYSAAISGL